MKKVQLIPLLCLVLCSGISLSSGLYYEINESLYLMPLLLVTGLFYLIRRFLAGSAKRDQIAFGIVLVVIFFFFIMLKRAVVPGFCDLMNTISDKVLISYGIDLGRWASPDAAYVGLAVYQFIEVVTVFSLFFYETKKPVVLTLLPSFLLFIVSITADGVPYESCFIIYSISFIVFLGMGRRGESLAKGILLVACAGLTCLIVYFAFSWQDVSTYMNEYRDGFVTFGGSGQVARQQEEEQEEDEKKGNQKINYGQFSREGDITYTGTVELQVISSKEFRQDELFLRGFIGESFRENNWYGKYMYSETDTCGNAFKGNDGLEVRPVFDKSSYVPFSVKKSRYAKIKKKTCELSTSMKNGVKEEVIKVPSVLKNKIEKKIIKGKSFKNIGQAVDFVSNYLYDNYEYTLHPGAVGTDDEIESFLFEKKKGYCTHYASSAVMIFRSMGIPARLAQGYMVSGDRLVPGAEVNVYDSNAHAWTEIYVEGEGWIPIDVTPYTNRIADEINARNRANSQEAEEEEDQADQADEVIPNVTEEDTKTEEEDVEEEDEEENTEEDSEEEESDPIRKFVTESDSWRLDELSFQDVAWLVFYLLLAGLFVVFCILLYQHLCLRKEREQMDRGDYSRRLMYINKKLQKFWAQIGSNWNYMDSRKLSEEIFKVSLKFYLFGNSEEVCELQKAINEYVNCVYRSRFDDESIGQEEYENCMQYIYQLLSCVQKNADKKFWKKCRKCSMVRIICERKIGGRQ